MWEIIVLSLLLWSPSTHADAIVEQSFDGGLFYTQIGHIELNPEGQGSALLSRDAWTSSDVSRLQTAVKDDGMYLVRVSLHDGQPISSSLPAACLAEHLNQEQWSLSIDDTGHLVGLQLAVPEGLCSKQRALEVLEAAPQQQQLSSSSTRPVELRSPQAAAAVVLTPQADMQQQSGGAQANQQQQRQGQQQQQQVQGGASGPAAANGTRGPPEPDNRTWWQKNWMFVMAGGVMVLNMMLKAFVGDLPQQGGPPPGRPVQRRQ